MELIKVASYVLLVIQGLVVLSLAKSTASDLGLKASKESEPDNAALGTLYRKPRQSRCIRCYDDRYADDGRHYSSSRNYYYGSSSGSSGGRTYDDRNWYYYPDRHYSKQYDDRYPERYGSRYDDRYVPRTYDRQDSRGYNDRYDSRGTPDFRGYGYDVPDKYYDRYNEGYNRDRYDQNRGGYEGRHYERDPYDRYPARGGGYDYKNYRPWDETYSSSYGGRPRPIGGSYLHDRDSNTPTAVKPINGDDKPEEAGKQPSDSDLNNSTSSSSSTN